MADTRSIRQANNDAEREYGRNCVNATYSVTYNNPQILVQQTIQSVIVSYTRVAEISQHSLRTYHVSGSIC